MRRYFWLVIVAAAMLWGGGQNLYSSLQNASPAEMTCRQYVGARTDDVWVRLSGCILGMDDYMYEGSATHPNQLFIPVLPADAAEDEPAAIVLVTRDAKLRKLVGDLERLSTRGDEQAIEKKVAEHAEEVLGARQIQGMVQFGIELDDDEKRQVSGLAENLNPDFVMIEDGASPNLALGIGMTGGGLLIVGILVIAFLRHRSRGRAAEKVTKHAVEGSPESQAFPTDPQARSGPGV